MRIELDKLEGQGGKFSHTYAVGELSLDEEDVRLTSPAEVRGRIRRSGEGVEVKGQLRAPLEVVCARCLKTVTLAVEVEFSEKLVPAVSWRSEQQHELSEEDLNLSVFEGDAVELDDIVREEILLAVPSHVLCNEDCQGLCPVCGIDRNIGTCQCEPAPIDSRWQKLEGLS